MPISRFTAFYPSRPFWAVSKIDFSDLNKNFQDLMSEEVYKDSSEAFSVKVCRDGRIMLRIEALEQDGLQPEAPVDIESTVRKWGEYLDYLNAFYLLLDSSVIRLMNLAHFNLHEITNRDTFGVTYENGNTQPCNPPGSALSASRTHTTADSNSAAPSEQAEEFGFHAGF